MVQKQFILSSRNVLLGRMNTTHIFDIPIIYKWVELKEVINEIHEANFWVIETIIKTDI